MGTVNMLINPTNAHLSITKRFEGEWQRTNEAIRVNNLIQSGIIGASFIANGIALMGISMAPVAGQMLFMVIIANAVLYIAYSHFSSRIKSDKERLSGGIFQELLIAPNTGGGRGITPVKIKIFKKWGQHCRKLRIAKKMYVAGGNTGDIETMTPTVRIGKFCKWAIEYIQQHAKIREEDLKKEVSENPHVYTIKLLQKVNAELGKMPISCNVDSREGNTLSNAMEKLASYVVKVGLLKALPKPREGELELIGEADIKRENDRIREEAIPLEKAVIEAFDSTFVNRLSISVLAKVISHCPKLENVLLFDEFQVKEIFRACKNPQEGLCAIHKPIAVWRMDNGLVSPCTLPTLREQWEANKMYTSCLVPLVSR